MFNVERKAAIPLVLAAILLVSSLVILSRATIPSAGPFYLDVPFGDSDYYVDKLSNGSFVAINCSTWHVVSTNTDPTTVINSVSSQNGIVQLATFTANTTATINVGKQTHLTGRGELNTIINVTGNFNGITIDATNTDFDWEVSQLQVEMNQKNGHGIYGAYMSSSGAKGINTIHHVRIDLVASGYAGIYANNLIKASWNTIMVRTYGIGYLFVCDQSVLNFGDSYFAHLQARLLGNNAVGFNISSWGFTANNQSLNIALFDQPYVYATYSSYTNTYAFVISITQYVTLVAPDFENTVWGLYCYQARDIAIYGGSMVSSSTGSIGVQLNSTSGGVTMFGGEIKTASFEWDDNSSWNKNCMIGVNLSSTPSTDGTNTDIVYGTH